MRDEERWANSEGERRCPEKNRERDCGGRERAKAAICSRRAERSEGESEMPPGIGVGVVVGKVGKGRGGVGYMVALWSEVCW